MVVVILALPEEFLQELKDRNDITDVVSSYVNLKRAGITIDYATGSSSGPDKDDNSNNSSNNNSNNSSNNTSNNNSSNSQSSNSGMVWIPQSGSKYHSHSGCSDMKNPSQVTQSEAESMGYEPCKKCY